MEWVKQHNALGLTQRDDVPESKPSRLTLCDCYGSQYGHRRCFVNLETKLSGDGPDIRTKASVPNGDALNAKPPPFPCRRSSDLTK